MTLPPMASAAGLEPRLLEPVAGRDRARPHKSIPKITFNRRTL
jgi:hypothetical protein